MPALTSFVELSVDWMTYQSTVSDSRMLDSMEMVRVPASLMADHSSIGSDEASP